MSNDDGRKTLNDPIPQDQLNRFEELAKARGLIAHQLLKLEQDKIYLLASAKQVDEQHKRLFEAIQIERGVAPGTPCEIREDTKLLTILQPEAEEASKAEAPAKETPKAEEAPAEAAAEA